MDRFEYLVEQRGEYHWEAVQAFDTADEALALVYQLDTTDTGQYRARRIEWEDN
jgi:hypothetical protein